MCIHDEGRQFSFNPAAGFIDFPGGMSKFTIWQDAVTGLYVTLSNGNTDPTQPRQRNVLALDTSPDLRHWRHIQTLLEDDGDLAWLDSVRLTGFQYVDWQFDGEDILYVVRMAYNGAHSYHDSNRITFHRLPGWRRLVDRMAGWDGMSKR